MLSRPQSFWVGNPAIRRVFAAAGLWLVVMGATVLAPGCYGRTCEGDTAYFGGGPGEGRLLTTDLWESNAIDGVWLPFPGKRAWVFDLTTLGPDRLPDVITPYVTAEADPTHTPGSNFTLGAGNIAELSGVKNGQVVVKNGTCATYYLRVVVQTTPRPPGAEAGAGPGTSATTTTFDAGNDAGSDAEAGP